LNKTGTYLEATQPADKRGEADAIDPPSIGYIPIPKRSSIFFSDPLMKTRVQIGDPSPIPMLRPKLLRRRDTEITSY
jgi:hypothetical protein